MAGQGGLRFCDAVQSSACLSIYAHMCLQSSQVLALGLHRHLLQLLLAHAADVDLASFGLIRLPDCHKVRILDLLFHLGDVLGGRFSLDEPDCASTDWKTIQLVDHAAILIAEA